MIKTLDELLQAAQKEPKVMVAVAVAQDEAALTAAIDAGNLGIADCHLFGDQNKIRQLVPDLNLDQMAFVQLHHCADDAEAAKNAVLSVRSGESKILLKGKVKTADLLKAVLDKETGLRTGRLLSDVFIVELPSRSDNKLILISDGGVNLKPNLPQKIEIIQNAVELAHALGNPMPRVAILSAVETVVLELPSTLDAAAITKMNERGQIKGCLIDGPLALDNAISEAAAAMKGIRSTVAGKAEILICPDIESANMMCKSTTYFANLRLSHVIMGAKAPILIPSRADTADAKLLSIALGKMVIGTA